MMRKSLVVKQVKYFYDLMNLNVSDTSSGGNNYKVINNWYTISTALYKLNEYSFIGNSIQDIFDLGAAFQSSSKTISIHISKYNDFLTKFDIVKAKCEAIIDSNSYDDDISNLYIKLPNNLNDLTNLSDIAKDLDTAFNKCPILNEKIGALSFKKVEEGSSWLVLAIGATIVSGAKVLDWIANYIKSCNEIRIQNRTIKGLDLDNILKEMEIDEKLQKQYKEKITTAEESKIRSLCINKFEQIGVAEGEISPEDQSRIVHSMKTLSDLLDNGVEIYPSLSSDEEIKKNFPKQEEFRLIEESQKLLEEPKENNE